MQLPELVIAPSEPIQKAADRFVAECQRLGIVLVGFESLNNVLPSSRFSSFFQARVDGVETIFLLMTEEWSNANLVKLLNILLEIRADPDPPGSELRFRIYSAHPPPPLLDTLFGDHRISPIECRAAMLAHFGSDLVPADCTRLAAACMQFLSSLGVRTSFGDPQAVRRVGEVVLHEVRERRFPPEATPLNFLICLGCLYGESLRTALPYPTEWVSVKEYLPWPCLVVRSASPSAGGEVQQLGLSPIALVIQVSQSGPTDLLERSAAALLERCRSEFAARAR
jgi:hypothetical protein